MASHLHLANRGGVYHWRRRLPAGFAKAFGRSQLLISMKLRDPRAARRLTRRLSVQFDYFLRPIQHQADIKQFLAGLDRRAESVAAADSGLACLSISSYTSVRSGVPLRMTGRAIASRHLAQQLASERRPAAEARRVGLGSSLIDEDQPRQIEPVPFALA